MKNKHIIWFFLLVIFLIPTQSNAQFGLGKLKKKKEKIEKEIKKNEETKEETKGILKETKPYDYTQHIVKTYSPKSDFHKNNMNAIFFSNSEISEVNIDENKLITDYSLGDPLYFRFFSENSLYNELVIAAKDSLPKNLELNATHKYVFSVNGNTVKEYFCPVRAMDGLDKEKKTSHRGVLLSKKYYKSEALKFFQDFLIDENFKPGTYTIGFQIIPYYNYDGTPLSGQGIEGTLNMTVKSNWLLTSPVKEYLCGMINKSQNKTLEEQMLKAIKSYKDGGFDPNIEKVEKVVVLQDDWKIDREKYTRKIIDRTIEGGFVFKNEGKCFLRKAAFKQGHNGNSFKTNETFISYAYPGEKPKEILCDCIH